MPLRGCARRTGFSSATTLGYKTKRPRKGAVLFSGGEGGLAASRRRMRLSRCPARTGFDSPYPFGKNAKGPGWGLSHFGGEGGKYLISIEIRGLPNFVLLLELSRIDD
jgi:hypothetical protein